MVSAKKAGVKHVLLCSSMGSTAPDNFLNKHLENVLFYKLNGEATLMAAGLPFTVVKPGGLLGEDIPAGKVMCTMSRKFRLRRAQCVFCGSIGMPR